MSCQSSLRLVSDVAKGDGKYMKHEHTNKENRS